MQKWGYLEFDSALPVAKFALSFTGLRANVWGEESRKRRERGPEREQAVQHVLLEGLALEMVSSQSLGMCVCLVMAGGVWACWGYFIFFSFHAI